MSDEPSRMSDLPPGPPSAPAGESALEGAAELGFASGAHADDAARREAESAGGAGEPVEATEGEDSRSSAAASAESDTGSSEEGLGNVPEADPVVETGAGANADAATESEGLTQADEGGEFDEEDVEEDEEDEEEGEVEDVEPIELIDESAPSMQAERNWYILKVQVNREESIRDAMLRRVKLAGLEQYFGDVVVPTEDVVEFTKTGKKRVVKKKLFPGYIVVDMVLNDDTWFLVRETPGIGDFTGSAGKPTPMLPHEVSRIIRRPEEEGAEGPKKMSIPFKPGNRVRVKEGYFQNFEGDVETIDEANGRVTVMINIFGRSTPVELEHWQVEAL